MLIDILKFAGLIVGAYLIGSINFARILSKLRKKDIDKEVSGNPGTTNMVRTHGMIIGVVTLLLDAGKGAVSALAGVLLFGGFDGGIMAYIALYVGGFAAVVGHDFPIYYKFKGGKGAATTFGWFMVANPLVAFIMFVVGLLQFLISRISSISSVLFIIAFPVYQIITNWKLSYLPIFIVLGLNILLCFWVFRGNIKRLFAGKENKIDLAEAVNKDGKLIEEIKTNLKKRNKNKTEENNKKE